MGTSITFLFPHFVPPTEDIGRNFGKSLIFLQGKTNSISSKLNTLATYIQHIKDAFARISIYTQIVPN